MGNLRVEELEPRQLLNGACAAPPSLFAEPFVGGIVVIGVVERVQVVVSGGHADFFGPCRPGEERAEFGLPEGLPFPDFGGRELGPAAAPAMFLSGLVAGLPDKIVSPATWPRTDPAEAGPTIAGRPATGEFNSAGFALTPPDSTAGIRRAFATVVEAVPPIRAESPPLLAENPVETPVGIEDEEVLPAPHVSDVLTTLPPIDLSALERGMHRFLDQVEEVGQRLGDSSGPGLYPWLAAVAAAAVACEVGRRQLKSPSLASASVRSTLAGFPPDEPFAE
jgi:hypothetical protein